MAPKRAKKTPAQQRADMGWQNLLTGFGDPTRDKRQWSSFLADRLTDEQCEEIWEGSDLGGRIVEEEPNEMFRAGFDLNIKADDDDTAKEISESVMSKWDDLRADEKMLRAKKFARAMRGGVVLIGANDGQRDLSKPLNLDRLQTISYLNPLPARCAFPVETYDDPLAPKFGQTSVYRIQPEYTGRGGKTQFVNVHETRLLVFQGITTTDRRMAMNNGWGVSIFVRILPVLRDFGALWDSVGLLVQDLAGQVAKINGLAGLVASQDEATVKARIALLDQMQSTLRTRVMDKEDDFARNGVPLAGVSDIASSFGARLAASVPMPVTRLLGTSPGGLNATGVSDERNWLSGVAARQETEVKPQRDYLLKLIMCCKDQPTKGKEPEKWASESKPLWQLNDSELADIRLKQAQIDQIEIDAGMIHPEEAAMGRHGGPEWSWRTPIDWESREPVVPPAKPDPFGGGDKPAPGDNPAEADPNAPTEQAPGQGGSAKGKQAPEAK